jgi:hypothetical protein
MQSEERPSMLRQVVLLVLALAGWTAFAAAFFGMVHAQNRAMQAEVDIQAMREAAEGVIHEKDRLIDLLNRQKSWLEERVAALERRP